ncbi:MAG: N-acetylmuramoyl-L-alanine amidase [Rhizobiaceae bacterium]|nr:N-acetylmuramoyl-L-alanine amidase [Rhizobiaceae bacterium]
MSFAADSSCVDLVNPAVNFGDRKPGLNRDNSSPDILLLHYTGMADDARGSGALKWLCCEESGVSCHYFIREDGEIVQLVREQDRAYHAGVGSWKGDPDTNSRSIGIEIVNGGHPAGLPDFPQVQMQAVARLSRDIIQRRHISPCFVLAHSDIAPGRKIDPGEKFNWGWLARHGVGHWVNPAPVRSGRFFQRGDTGEPVEALQSMLALYGYGVEISGSFDDQTHIVVEAFQRHFRPEQVDGVADISTIETLHQLLKSLPAG